MKQIILQINGVIVDIAQEAVKASGQGRTEDVTEFNLILNELTELLKKANLINRAILIIHEKNEKS